MSYILVINGILWEQITTIGLDSFNILVILSAKVGPAPLAPPPPGALLIRLQVFDSLQGREVVALAIIAHDLVYITHSIVHTTRKQLNECIAYLHVKDCWGKSSHFLFGRSTTQVQEDKQRKLNYHHPMGANILPLHLFPAIYPARGDLVWKKHHLFLLVSLHPLIWTKYIAGKLCVYLCVVIIDMCLPCTRIRVLTPPPLA